MVPEVGLGTYGSLWVPDLGKWGMSGSFLGLSVGEKEDVAGQWPLSLESEL